MHVHFISAQRPAPHFPAEPGPLTDYARVRFAIEFLTTHWRAHLDLDQLAAELDLSPAHVQKLFKRWCGLSPKEFVQAIAIDHARALLAESTSLLDTALEVGLSGPGRLHDLFVDHEAMTPGDYKRRGAGLTMHYGFHPCPFGLALIVATGRDFHQRVPHADLEVGADQNQVEGLGRACTYSDLARHLGKPNAARAVGAAVGRNPISFVVPCHRVLGKSGDVTGYHWGVTRKHAIIGWEKGYLAGAAAR